MTDNNTFYVPAGAIPQRSVRPLTDAERARLIQAKQEKFRASQPATTEQLEKLAEKFAPVYKVRNVTPESKGKDNNGFGRELSDNVDWNKQAAVGKGKSRLSAKAARSASKK